MSDQGLKILVVDDEQDTREIVKMILAAENPSAEIFEASNGIDAVNLYRKENFDLMLLDVDMPGLDGWGTLTVIRDEDLPHNENTSIYMVTARNTDVARAKANNFGAKGFVYKPFESQEIARLLYAP